MIKTIYNLIEILESNDRSKHLFPPTEVYSEGWMLRLVLNWFSNNQVVENDLSFFVNSRWFSEALLSSKFLPLWRGDNLSESWTHADGVIGHFEIGNNGNGDLKITDNAKQLIVCEAKMFSKYSSGTKNAPKYNQVARNVACMCNICTTQKNDINEIKIGFFGLIPEIQLKNERTFNIYIAKQNIGETVLNRINQYKERSDFKEKIDWYNDKFVPFLEHINIQNISWESVIDYIQNKDSVYGLGLNEFYQKCIIYNNVNKKKHRTTAST